MRSANRSLLERLEHERRDVERRLSLLRRRHHVAVVPDFDEQGTPDLFDAAAKASTGHHEEVLRRRLADKSQALADAWEQVREGTYGLCRLCGQPIPRRRLEAIPTATLCVRCQEEVEAARAT
ncbi:MAG TPA: TraR/DksA C4-type zinc finger protein [Candidatus Methylomirabilis sp.]|nr:TraR/DksA C4-type zinc finger protein [Candidatus Methylomirabilis sp.]